MEHGGVSKAERLAQVREMRKGRVDLKGKPLPGYAKNLEAVDAEIARLESEIAEGAK
jgi:hypothetical protein